eukprot:228299-Ditylum_brightwellii.AAC.1
MQSKPKSSPLLETVMEGEDALSEEEMKDGKTKTIENEDFPFLDMTLTWDEKKTVKLWCIQKIKASIEVHGY